MTLKILTFHRWSNNDFYIPLCWTMVPPCSCMDFSRSCLEILSFPLNTQISCPWKREPEEAVFVKSAGWYSWPTTRATLTRWRLLGEEWMRSETFTCLVASFPQFDWNQIMLCIKCIKSLYPKIQQQKKKLFSGLPL